MNPIKLGEQLLEQLTRQNDLLERLIAMLHSKLEQPSGKGTE